VSLTKEALLKLKSEGFVEAEKAAIGIASAFKSAEKWAVQFEAAARAVNAPLAVTDQALELIRSDAAHAVAQFKLMETELGRVAAQARVAAAAVGGVHVPGAGAPGVPAGAPKILPGPGSGAAPSAGGAAGVASAAALSDLLGPAAAVAGALYTAKAGAEALFETLSRGEAAATTAESFEKLTTSIGGADSTLAAMNEATGGVVTNQNLMLAANRLLVGDLGLSQEQIAKLSGAAVVLSNAMGTSATEALMDMSDGLRKQNPRLLESLGLTVQMDDALKAYAKEHHVAADAIDEHQKKLIFTQVVMDGATEASAKLGKTAKELANPTEIMTKLWSDFGSEIDRLTADQPGFAEALKATADAAIAIGTALTPLIQLAGEVAHELAPVIKMMGEATAFVAKNGWAAQLLGGAISNLAPGAGAFVGAPIGAIGAAQSAASARGLDGKGSGKPASNVNISITAGATQEAVAKTRAALERVEREQGAANGWGG